jgi:hypothetical protein
MPNERLQAINKWAVAHKEMFADPEAELPEPDPAAAEIGLRKSDFVAAISLIGTVLLGDTNAEELGIADLAEPLKTLLAGLHLPPEQAEYARQKGLALQSGIPTLESANALCDLRAIFRRLPSPGAVGASETGVKTLLGFEPVVLVSLALNDAVGNDNAILFQVSERNLRNLLKSIQQALSQIEVVKEAHKVFRQSKELQL